MGKALILLALLTTIAMAYEPPSWTWEGSGKAARYEDRYDRYDRPRLYDTTRDCDELLQPQRGIWDIYYEEEVRRYLYDD